MARSNRFSGPRTNRRVRPPTPPPRRLTGVVRDIGARGDGVIETSEGVVYAPLTAPGDEGVFEVRGDRARLLELTTSSRRRAAPPCPHFGVCGGCALQHVDDAFYADWKRGRVAEALARARIETTLEDLVRVPVASRRRAVFTITRAMGAVRVGFNRARSSEIVPVEGCVVLRPDLAAALPDLHAIAAAVPAEGFDMAVTAADNGLDIEIRSRRFRDPAPGDIIAFLSAIESVPFARISLNGAPLLTREAPAVAIGQARATPPPGGFLQASAEGEAAIAACVLEAAKSARRAADLVCGIGALALRLAGTMGVYAADGDGPALAALRDAARDAAGAGRIAHPVEVERRDLDERPLMAEDLKAFDFILFDPPRAGAEAQTRQIAASRAALVVGVSCNPATFARDAAILVEAGFCLERVTPIDQFVYSPHVELVGVFRR